MMVTNRQDGSCTTVEVSTNSYEYNTDAISSKAGTIIKAIKPVPFNIICKCSL